MRLGEDAAVARGVAGGKRAGGTEEVCDGAAARGQDRSAQEHQEAAIGGLGEDWREGVEQCQGLIG